MFQYVTLLLYVSVVCLKTICHCYGHCSLPSKHCNRVGLYELYLCVSFVDS